MSYMQDEK